MGKFSKILLRNMNGNAVIFGVKHHCDMKIKFCTNKLRVFPRKSTFEICCDRQLFNKLSLPD
jgi:hypothetical protein